MIKHNLQPAATKFDKTVGIASSPRTPDIPVERMEEEAVISDDESLEDVSTSIQTFYRVNAEVAPFMGRNTDTALKRLTWALDQFPDQRKWYLARGMVLHQKRGRKYLSEAIIDLTAAIGLGPKEGVDEGTRMALLARGRARAEIGKI